MNRDKKVEIKKIMAESRRVQFFFLYSIILCNTNINIYYVGEFFLQCAIFSHFSLLYLWTYWMIQQQNKQNILIYISSAKCIPNTLRIQMERLCAYNKNKMHLMVVWLNAITSTTTNGKFFCFSTYIKFSATISVVGVEMCVVRENNNMPLWYG